MIVIPISSLYLYMLSTPVQLSDPKSYFLWKIESKDSIASNNPCRRKWPITSVVAVAKAVATLVHV